MNFFGQVSNGGVAHSQILKFFADHAGFLTKLPETRLTVILSELQLSRGKLGERLLKRISELLHHEYFAFLRNGDNTYSAGVHHQLPRNDFAVFKLGAVFFYGDYLSVENKLGAYRFFKKVHIKASC